MTTAEPLDGTYTTENGSTEDEYLVSECQHCPREVMTLIGQDQDTWVHVNTESVDCVLERPKPTKAQLLEIVERVAEAGDTGARKLLGFDGMDIEDCTHLL